MPDLRPRMGIITSSQNRLKKRLLKIRHQEGVARSRNHLQHRNRQEPLLKTAEAEVQDRVHHNISYIITIH